MSSFYSTLSEANDYFDNRLHERAWSEATVANRQKALLAATRIIDQLNFKGHKATVHTLLEANPCATDEEIRAAEAEQELEFPRGEDTLVPETIKLATYEIAYNLLDERDPEKELERLMVTSERFANVATGYNRDQVPIDHILNHIPSALAWRWLAPFLRDDDTLKLSRVS